MQCLLSILTSVSIQYTALKSPRDRFQQKKVCSNPLDRGEGERIYILTRFRYARKESKDSTLTV